MKTLIKVTILLFIIYILVSLCSCGQKAWKQRGLKHGWIDTITVTNSVEVTPDTIVRDSIIKVFVREYETINTVEEKTKYIKEFVNKYNEQVYPDTIVSFPDGSKVRIWFENGILKGSLVYEKTDIKEVPLGMWDKYKDWIFGFFFVLILIIVLWKR